MMAMSRAGRIRNQPVIYTPTRHTTTNYRLNKEKAIRKKIDAANREYDVKIEDKRGTLVITCTAAAYEVLRKELNDLYWSPRFTKKCVDIGDKRALGHTAPVVETSLSICDPQSSHQLYRINMFHTTSRMDVNGKHYATFISEDLPIVLANLEATSSLRRMNESIKKWCNDYLRQSDIRCIVCRRPSKTRAVECTACRRWVHYVCDKLSDREIDALESNSSSMYTCKLCTQATKLQISQAGEKKVPTTTSCVTALALPPIHTANSATTSTATDILQEETQIDCDVCCKPIDRNKVTICDTCSNNCREQCISSGDERYQCLACTALQDDYTTPNKGTASNIDRMSTRDNDRSVPTSALSTVGTNVTTLQPSTRSTNTVTQAVALCTTTTVSVYCTSVNTQVRMAASRQSTGTQGEMTPPTVPCSVNIAPRATTQVVSSVRSSVTQLSPAVSQSRNNTEHSTVMPRVAISANNKDKLTTKSHDLRQKEEKLRKREEDLKQKQAIIDGAERRQKEMENYIEKVEARNIELEKSIRILKRKLVISEEKEVGQSSADTDRTEVTHPTVETTRDHVPRTDTISGNTRTQDTATHNLLQKVQEKVANYILKKIDTEIDNLLSTQSTSSTGNHQANGHVPDISRGDINTLNPTVSVPLPPESTCHVAAGTERVNLGHYRAFLAPRTYADFCGQPLYYANNVYPTHGTTNESAQHFLGIRPRTAYRR